MKHWKIYGKRLAVLWLAVSLACSGAGCGSGEENSLSSESGAKGRYVETKLSLPKDALPLALGEEKGKLRLLCDNGAFESDNGGADWKKLELGSGLFQKLSGKGQISKGSWGAEGELLFTAYSPGEEGREKHYYVIDKNGEEKELPIILPEWNKEEEESGLLFSDAPGEAETAGAAEFSEEIMSLLKNSLVEFAFLPDGSIVGRDQEGVVFHISQSTGEILHTLKPDSAIAYYDGFAVTEDTLVLYYSFGGGGARLYDLSTWQQKEPDEVLSGFLASGEAVSQGEVNSALEQNTGVAVDSVFEYSTTGGILALGNSSISLFTGPGEEAFYLCNSGGVYRHVPGGGSVEQVINGAMSSLADPSLHLQNILKTASGSFKALCWEESSGEYSLLSYDFDPEISAVPETELRAYTLYDSAELRQFIAMYQKTHPDVYINLEVALANSGALTESDALRTLNANIMAGNGPDLLFLDNMPIKNYMEKGLLANISDVVEQAREAGGLLENVISPYQKEGEYLAVPGRFSMPVLLGDKSRIASVTNLSSLAQTVEELRRAGPEKAGITGLSWPYSLLEHLFVVSAPAWLEEDGSLNREQLEDFFRQCQRIYEAETENLSQEEENQKTLDFTVSSVGASLLGVDLLSGNSQLLLEQIDSISGFSCLVSVKDKLESLGFVPFSGQSSGVFTPKTVVGISAKSNQIEKAKEFVRFLLSKEGQQHSQGVGLPVNKDALAGLLQEENTVNGGIAVMSDDGSYNMELMLRSPTQEELLELLEQVSTLNLPALQDRVIYEAVMEQGSAFLLGEKSLQEAVDEVMKQVSLYLSEAA